MMEKETIRQPSREGIIVKGIGGLYEVRLDVSSSETEVRTVLCRARGSFRHSGISPLTGDRVRVVFGTSAEKQGDDYRKKKRIEDTSEDCDTVIDDILTRKNALLRPPLANLDVLFTVIPAAQPTPILETADKLMSIAEHSGIEPVILITKADLSPAYADELTATYRRCGFDAFCISSVTGEGTDAVLSYIRQMEQSYTAPIAAFAGASGAGKSTLMNRLFPHLHLVTAEISRKIERGRHTTREVCLYPLAELLPKQVPMPSGYLADTPGFSMLDFTRFDFFRADQLPFNFREFIPYLGKCRYTRCTHTKEEGCLILEAVARGDIPRTRHESYVSLYETLRQIPDWQRQKEKKNENRR